MPYGIIYKIPFPNGKNYIGLTTTSLEQRKNEHKKDAKDYGNTRILYNALRKYNMVDTFELIEIDTADTLEELYEKEIKYIQEYNSYYLDGNGYNMTYGGDGVNGYVYTEEDKLKMSEAQKKYYENNPEARQKNSEAQKKYHQDNPDAGKEHSERLKKHYDNPEVRQQHSETLKKYYQDNPEAIQQMSEARKKYFENNPEAGKEHSERLKKYFEKPESIQKNSEAQKKYYENNPEARQKMSEIIKKHYGNPEARKKSLDGRGKNKQFDVFTVDGTFIKTFTYKFEAIEYLQKEYNITSTMKINEVLKKKRKSTAGFVFKYK
jgi:CHASE3 domain sensor protein